MRSSTPLCSFDADNALLEIAADIRSEDGSLDALSREPWLRFRSLESFEPGRFVEIRYASSPFDPPARPLLRFWLGEKDFREHVLPAPCEGGGIWIGRVPKARTAVWISPTNRPGPFEFRVTEARPAPFATTALRAARSPKRLFFALCASMVGLREEAELNWRWALGAEPLSAYPAWRKARRDVALVAGLGRPRSDWRTAPEVCVLLDVGDATVAEIDESCGSIARQSYPNWRALFVGTPLDAAAAERQADWERQERFARFRGGEIRFEERSLLARLRAGDRLEDDALACFVEHFARHPAHKLAYADETHGDGRELRRRFKPGWSPTLQRSESYLGRSAFFRAELVAASSDWSEAAPEALIDRLAAEAAAGEVGALHRPLFALAREAPRCSKEVAAVDGGRAPSVAIIIPTRDKPDLLEACLESVFEKTTHPNFTVTVVDNDSADPRTRRLLARLKAAHERLEILPAPGPFNFSALCNSAVEATAGDYLLFLNNDTRVLTPDWIERLLDFATQPEIGAVGAKLLYPGGLTQHVGVLLGMGGVAGHFGAGLGAREPGWTRRNLVPHEVSAATGACLMVERRKFDAVGRFDAANLPVDLNDVDLCLRLKARGWRTICQSQVVLIHHQSASRGGGLRLQRVYEKERRYFCERWRSEIRDDPYFHPGLSLYAYEEMLP